MRYNYVESLDGFAIKDSGGIKIEELKYLEKSQGWLRPQVEDLIELLNIIYNETVSDLEG
jgi:hypothetical protein